MKVLDASRNFLGLDDHAGWDEARAVIIPAALELTTTYMAGTVHGPEALLEASHQVELYDDELGMETYLNGIATLAVMRFTGMSPEASAKTIQTTVSTILDAGKRPTLVGGEHSVTVGAVRAVQQQYPDVSVLHMDAHADLRDRYEDSKLNHACVMARVAEICPFVSVGIRSLCKEEADAIQEQDYKVLSMHHMRENKNWIDEALSGLSDTVYITLDLDALDPSIMPAVGTPEPGGMGWFETLKFLKRVFQSKQVVGLDMVELCPRPGAEAGVFAAAKLLYRMLGYWFFRGRVSI